jgi:CRISPR-associated protein Cmr1
MHLTLRASTPVFLAGQDNSAPEWRAASVRGVMRYWLRALLARQAGNTLEVLRQAEKRIMGSTGMASPVVVRATFPADQGSPRTASYYLLPHTGRARAPAFAPDSRFVLDVRPRPGVAVPDLAVAALALALTLGGLGRRSRRGFGSLEVESADGAGLSPQSAAIIQALALPAKDGAALAARVRAVVDAALQVAPTGASVVMPEYPSLVEAHAKVLVCQTGQNQDHDEAMKPFWGLLRSHYQDERAFGSASPRRASPVLLHMAETDQGYHYVITVFRSRPEPMAGEGWNVVADFLGESHDEWNGAWVFGGPRQ